MILLYVLLCLVSVVLIALVLMQDSKSGLGGLTGGTTMSSFGANTDKVLIKFTGGAGAAFFILVICIHLGNKSDAGHKSIMPSATTEKKASTPSVTIPAHDLNSGDNKAKESTKESTKDKTPAKEAAEPSEPKGTSVTIPLKDAKEAPASETKPEAKEKAVTPAEPEKK